MEPGLHPGRGMAYREFVDRAGKTWRVWSTTPSMPRALGRGLEEGWLTFEAEDERRRYAPIPTDWGELGDERLELFCRMAQPVTRRTPPRGAPSDGSDAESR